MDGKASSQPAREPAVAQPNGDQAMKHNTPGALHALLLAAALCLAGAGQAADKHDAHAAHQHDGAATLQLNDGKKWETDAPLRKSMAQIRQSVNASLHKIHENKLPASGYDSLAHRIESEVGTIVSNCKLEPKADAQLHLIVADLLAGAEQMAGKSKDAKRQGGAVKVIGALDNYAKYFDDPKFKPIKH
jgi:hypothetical protein